MKVKVTSDEKKTEAIFVFRVTDFIKLKMKYVHIVSHSNNVSIENTSLRKKFCINKNSWWTYRIIILSYIICYMFLYHYIIIKEIIILSLFYRKRKRKKNGSWLIKKRLRSKKLVWTDQFGRTSLPWFWQKFIVRYGARYSARTFVQIRLLGFAYHPLWTCNQFHWFPL